MDVTPNELISDPLKNKGTAFTQEERDKFGLNGLIPPVKQTIEEQAKRVYQHYQSKPDNLEKRLFLMDVYAINRTLFYYLMGEHLVEFMPIVYDPTVAESIEKYSDLYLSADAVYLSIDDPDDIGRALKHFADGRMIRLIAVTDGEGILGIGDWGLNGGEIATGKLAVYTAAAGINPEQVIPVVLDVGTNNPKLLDNPNYLGNRHKRIYGKLYDQFIDRFVQEVARLFPDALLHWEDFGRSNAANILEKYQDKLCTFNDDIQGTGVVILAALNGSMRISQLSMQDQKIIVFGAGTAGCGIADQIAEAMVRDGHMAPEEAKMHFYLIDRQGLILDNMADLTEGQRKYARPSEKFDHLSMQTLIDVVKQVHPTVLIGTSTAPGAFTEEVVKEMSAHTERPAIFPISNPTKLVEAKAADVIKWSDGKALVCTGIPSDPVEWNGVTYKIGQGNNALVYPGIGFGAIVAHAKVVNKNMLIAAAKAVGDIIDYTRPGAPILPEVGLLKEISRKVAIAVVTQAVKDHVNRVDIEDPEQAVDQCIWKARY